MRFSIVFDDNGTILGASEGGEEVDKPMPDPGVSSGYVEISDDLPDAELHQTVERVLVDLDASELTHSPARGEADDTKFA
ncbi:MAG TPA: hypothetical protein VI030_05745 [Propionibacteriaceae bacterium]